VKTHLHRNRQDIRRIEALLSDSRPPIITGERRFKVVFRWRKAEKESRIVKANSQEEATESIKYDIGQCRILSVKELLPKKGEAKP
jgi:hypothetical protein